MPMLHEELSPFDYPPSFYENPIAAHYAFVELGVDVINGESKAIEIGHLLRVKNVRRSKSPAWVNGHIKDKRIKTFGELRKILECVKSHMRQT